jgi:hypothetical protein
MSNCPDRVCPDNWNPHANRSFSRVRSRDRSWGRSRERPRGRDREDFGDDKVWGRDVFRVRVGGIGRQAFQSAVSNGYMASMEDYVRPPVPPGRFTSPYPSAGQTTAADPTLRLLLEPNACFWSAPDRTAASLKITVFATIQAPERFGNFCNLHTSSLVFKRLSPFSLVW